MSEESQSVFESLYEKGEQYARTSLEVIKLKTIDKSADVTSNLVSWVVIIVFGTLFFLILNVGLALWIGSLLGASYYGFFIVSGFYGILALICAIFRKQLIKKPLNNSIVDQFLE